MSNIDCATAINLAGRKIGRLETFYSCDVPDGLPYIGFPQLTASRPRLHPEITAVTEGKEHLPRCMGGTAMWIQSIAFGSG